MLLPEKHLTLHCAHPSDNPMPRLIRIHAVTFLVVTFFCASPLYGQQWQPLFDGLSFNGWVQANGDPVDSDGWQVEDGMLHLDRSRGRGGNLLTDRDYGDFELVFEWKVAEKANNGIKYRVKEFGKRMLGIEYQVIDDFGNPKLTADHKTASIYDIYEAREHDFLRPAGEFNRGRIVVHNNRLEHWLNGHLITSAQVGGDDWKEHIANSKFSDVEGFGVNQLGRIMLTDHNDEVWYRNVFIRELTSVQATVEVPSCQPQCPPAPCCPPVRCRLRRLFR